jgi:amino acid transporter
MTKDRPIPFWLQFVIVTGILIFILFLFLLIASNQGKDTIWGVEDGIIIFIISGIGDLISLKIHKKYTKNCDFKDGN